MSNIEEFGPISEEDLADLWNDPQFDGLHNGEAVLAFARALLAREGERAEVAMWKAVPKAHTYASENADVYHAGDLARDRCIQVLRRMFGVKA